jgi:hypothetical protein
MRRLPFLAAFAIANVAGASSAWAKTVNVTNATDLLAAISGAAAGDEIVLASGTYALAQSPVCGASGTTDAPIVVRSATPLGARIEFDALEGFHVTAPNWHFEGLDVHGVCANDSDCEHGFHVTGGATGVVLRNNRIVDFNAQLKVNADKPAATWLQPNGGLVEGNDVFDTHSRATSNPVTKLNIDGADGWIVRGNVLHDGHKNGGDNTSYQAFMKGGGKNGLFERNLVLCTKDETSGGTRIGISLGGGGTDPQFCAPAFNAAVPCVPEMSASVIRNNIIVNCSDVGIYLNQAKDTEVLYNTLIATSGVDFRFAASSGEADGNVLASALRTRDGATMTLKTNLSGLAPTDFAAMFVAPLTGDLRKKGDLSSLIGKGTARADVTDDYCARQRAGAYDLGALQVSLGDCDTTTPPPGDGGIASDAGSDASAAPPGTPPGGTTTSAASPDGGSSSGAAASAAPSSDGGCGCRAAGGDARRPLVPGVLGVASALGLLVVFRQRRRNRRASAHSS